jgi:hypothetical protein
MVISPMHQQCTESVLNNANVCEAMNCFAEATIQIEVRVGQLGTITLSLCKNCVNKFTGDH